MKSFADFVAERKPVKNAIIGHEAPCGGYMFETLGPELEFVMAQMGILNVWTLVDYEETTYIMPGFHFVNRLGYFLTEVPPVNADEEYAC
jgi:hypothetical protein